MKNALAIVLSSLWMLPFSIPAAEAAVEANDANDAVLYERGSNFKKKLCKFNKDVKMDGAVMRVRNLYTDAQGKLMIEEKIDYLPDGSLDKYSRNQLQINEETTMEHKGKRVFFYKKEKGKEEKDDEAWSDEHITTDQIHPFLRKHWDALMAGKSVDLRLLVPSRTESVGFSIEKLKTEGNIQGAATTIFEMSPSSMIIRAIVSPIQFHYSKDEKRRLLMIDGRMPVKEIEKNGNYSDIVGQLLFGYDQQKAAAAAAAPNTNTATKALKK